jgi:tetratricopeptide (TPR) repeat protein
MPCFKFWILMLVLLTSGVVTARASAQGGTSSPKSQIARDLFERGKEKWASGDYEQAAALLAASQHQLPRPGTLMLLGDAHERLGRLHSARQAFQRAAELARADGNAELEYRASTREAALVPRLPQLELRVPRPLPRGLVVTLNGVEVPAERLNTSVEMDGGRYQVEARALGYKPFSVLVALSNDGPSPRAAQVIVVLLAPDGENSPPEPEDPVESRRRLAWWVGGAGGALVLASVVAMVVAVDKKQSSEAECGRAAGALGEDPNACTAPGVALRDDARLLANLATAGGLLGLAGMGGGVALYVSAGSAQEPASAGLSWSSDF